MAYKIEGLIVLSHAIPSKELASFQIPVVTIEREDEYINSINTDNYMGSFQATSLLIKNECDVLIHINSNVPETVPAYGRIKGFCDLCNEQKIPHELILSDFGDSYNETKEHIQDIFLSIKDKYPNM